MKKSNLLTTLGMSILALNMLANPTPTQANDLHPIKNMHSNEILKYFKNRGFKNIKEKKVDCWEKAFVYEMIRYCQTPLKEWNEIINLKYASNNAKN